MTVVDEVSHRETYFVLKFVEFLEFIGRIAYVKYREDPEHKDLELDEKIEKILDDVFAVYGLKRKSLKEGEDDDETSEESVLVDDEEYEDKTTEKGYRALFTV